MFYHIGKQVAALLITIIAGGIVFAITWTIFAGLSWCLLYLYLYVTGFVELPFFG